LSESGFSGFAVFSGLQLWVKISLNLNQKIGTLIKSPKLISIKITNQNPVNPIIL